MKVSRRQLLLYGTAGLCAATFPAIALSSTNKKKPWEASCRQWMQVILPADKYGSGADHPLIWQRLYQILGNQPDLERWFEFSFSRLQQIALPATQVDLEQLFMPSSPYASFLKYFRNIIVENYYSSVIGWNDLGFSSPPQPKGYQLKGSVPI